MSEENEVKESCKNSESLPGKSDSSSIGALLRAWFARNSLPRILGLFLGNTRDLESQLSLKEREMQERLRAKDIEIDYLKAQLVKWETQCITFQDSILLGRGMKPTVETIAPVSQPLTTTVTKQSNTDNLGLYGEVDRLQEMFFYRPEAVEEALKDLEATGTPRNKEVIKHFVQWVDSLPPITEGVIIKS